MTTTDNRTTAEDLIRNVIDDWAKAIRARDLDKMTSNYAPNVLSFDVVEPLQSVGVGAIRERAEEWISSFVGPIGYEIRDLSVTAGDDVAFCHSLNRVSATRVGGHKLDMWWRATVCFQKRGGQWLATHQHNSVPFDVQSGKASLDIRP